jgi:protoporphyrinogen oxidase
LVAGIEDLGGKLHLGQPVTEVVTESGEVRGVRTPDGGTRRYDQIISTVPTPLVPEMVPGLPDADKAAYAAIRNIAVVCVVLKLRRPVTPHFWLNVNDSSMLIPGLVEFSNLRPLPDPVVYVPYYMPTTHPRFGRADADFIAESVGYLCRINPDVSASDVLATQVGRLRHAQPVCPPGFAARLPKVMTSIRGLQIADTCFYYPEDRGVSESLRYGQLLATGLTEREIWDQEAR